MDNNLYFILRSRNNGNYYRGHAFANGFANEWAGLQNAMVFNYYQARIINSELGYRCIIEIAPFIDVSKKVISDKIFRQELKSLETDQKYDKHIIEREDVKEYM
ncbi:MAG: hypothetical protein ACOCRK_02390 [bacterium]